MSRICTKCQTEKEEHEYPAPVDIQRKKGIYRKRRPHCKDCVNDYQRRMAKKNKPKYFFEVDGMMRDKRKLWELYKMTPEDYIAMYNEQDGLCAICQIARAAVVDHCHNRGHVRALLCQHCNIMLGAAHDNVSILARGIEYLNQDVGA